MDEVGAGAACGCSRDLCDTLQLGSRVCPLRGLRDHVRGSEGRGQNASNVSAKAIVNVEEDGVNRLRPGPATSSAALDAEEKGWIHDLIS